MLELEGRAVLHNRSWGSCGSRCEQSLSQNHPLGPAQSSASRLAASQTGPPSPQAGRVQLEPGREEAQASEEQALQFTRPLLCAGCKAAFQGWRPFHAHRHPPQNFLDRLPVISDQSMPGTAAVHGLDFFYKSEIDYQQTFCPSPSIKLSGRNNVICFFFFFILAGFLLLFWGTKGEFIYSFIQFIQQIFIPRLPL